MVSGLFCWPLWTCRVVSSSTLDIKSTRGEGGDSPDKQCILLVSSWGTDSEQDKFGPKPLEHLRSSGLWRWSVIIAQGGDTWAGRVWYREQCEYIGAGGRAWPRFSLQVGQGRGMERVLEVEEEAKAEVWGEKVRFPLPGMFSALQACVRIQHQGHRLSVTRAWT